MKYISIIIFYILQLKQIKIALKKKENNQSHHFFVMFSLAASKTSKYTA